MYTSEKKATVNMLSFHICTLLLAYILLIRTGMGGDWRVVRTGISDKYYSLFIYIGLFENFVADNAGGGGGIRRVSTYLLQVSFTSMVFFADI